MIEDQGHGFTSAVPEDHQRVVPVPGPGRYRVRLVLGGWDRATEVTAFLGPRRCVAWKRAVEPGQDLVVERTEVIGPVLRGNPAPRAVGHVRVVVTGPWIRSVDVVPAPEASAVHIGGDSTVADQGTPWPWEPDQTYCGWGQMLPLFLSSDVGVANHAHSGLTTETFRGQGHWSLVEGALRPGDLVLFQFGHNDQKVLHLGAQTGYRTNLARYVAEVRSRGAVPVLVTPVTRNLWNAPGGRFNDLLAPQAQACRDLGHELAVPLVDLHAASVRAVQTRGCEASRPWFHPGDTTHHNDEGGLAMASLVAQGLIRALPGWGRWWATPAPGSAPPSGQSVAPEAPGPLTRADWLALVMARAQILPGVGCPGLFSDVTGHEWYAGSVVAGWEHGLWDPALTPGRFDAQAPVTGADLEDMAARALGFKGPWSGPPPRFDAGIAAGARADHRAAQRVLDQLAKALGTTRIGA